MITGVNHIAIAVSDFERAIERFAKDFGFSYQGEESVASAQTKTAFFDVGNTAIELVHPLNDKGPIKTYLDKQNRGGLHHICFECDDIEADVARLKDKGYQFITEQPYEGAHGARVIFIHPKSCDGVLIELSQPAKNHG